MAKRREKHTKIQDRDRIYAFLRNYVDFSLKIAYRKIRYLGKENIPDRGAVIYSPNHTNALMDALVVLAIDKKPKVYVARADIFKNPKIARILAFLKIMPINRIRDGRSTLAENDEVFRKSVDVLKDNVPFCILPEGTHNAKHSLLPLGKGVFRIALAAEELIEDDIPLYILPVGIEYGNFFRYRSTVLVQIGEPVNVREFINLNESVETPELMNLMKEDLAVRMKDLILYIPDDEYYDQTMELCAILYREQREKRGSLAESRGKGILELRYLTNRHIAESIALLREKKPQDAVKLFEAAGDFRKVRCKKRISLLSISRNKPLWHTTVRALLFLVTLPYLIFSVTATLPVLLVNTLLLSKFQDKAFYNSIRFVVTLVLWPLLLLIYTVVLFTTLKWYIAISSLILIIPSIIWGQDLLRNIRLLASDGRFLFSLSLRKTMREISELYYSIINS